MSYAKVWCVALVGVQGHLVEVEVDIAQGLPGVALTGLPDTALNEARDRVRAAIVNSGEHWPNRRLTINLLPATLPKRGSAFDLAIAAGILAGAGELPPVGLDRVAILGELGLDGTVRPVRGILPMVAAAARAGLTRAVVPLDNADEATVVPGVEVRAVDTLQRLVGFVRGSDRLLDPPGQVAPPPASTLDLADVSGQEIGRRAVEVAAAGAHHLALIGPPGAGKTMLAERLPSILPELDDEAALEVTALHSIAGTLPAGGRLIRRPPFQAPHHTASVSSLVGGGSGTARPGSLSLAHRGVLFLDEAPEYGPRVLESLRQPLEDGVVTIGRSGGSTRYPARVLLVVAANPCPCAKPAGDAACECTALARRRYLSRLSGPLMDRIDLRVRLLPTRSVDLIGPERVRETSALVAERVAKARAAAVARWSAQGWRTNAEVPGPRLREAPWRLPADDLRSLERALDRGTLTARGFDRILRLAWTLSDLDGRSRPDAEDVAEARQLRTGEQG